MVFWQALVLFQVMMKSCMTWIKMFFHPRFIVCIYGEIFIVIEMEGGGGVGILWIPIMIKTKIDRITHSFINFTNINTNFQVGLFLLFSWQAGTFIYLYNRSQLIVFKMS
jgi:hypothetical protein